MLLSQSKKFTILKIINNYILPILVFLSIIIIFSLMIYVSFFSIDFKKQEIITILIAGVTALGLLITYKQITINVDLQKRKLALENIRIIAESNKKHRDELHKYMDFTNFYKKHAACSSSFSVEEIKKLLFEDDGNNNYKGKGTKDEPYKFSDNGRHIHSHIIEILNNFETLAIGILNNIYDETVMKEYFDNIVKTNYIVYRNHITYLRSESILNDKKYCENFEWLYSEWNKKPSKDKR
jgi:hypothetical protein